MKRTKSISPDVIVDMWVNNEGIWFTYREDNILKRKQIPSQEKKCA